MENAKDRWWARAQKVNPLGIMTQAKHPSQADCEEWPIYYSKARGCTLWDLSGNRYQDVGLMGCGANTLGYAKREINHAARRAIGKGPSSTLGCLEEILLIEKLVELHPWAEQGILLRSGSEGVGAAVRLARSATNKSLILVCGFHGWHDPYLAGGLQGGYPQTLKSGGVPEELTGTTILIENLEDAGRYLKEGQVAAVLIDIRVGGRPDKEALEKIVKEARKAGAVVIFDEVTTGFRENPGGLHLTLGVEPDLMVAAKALGQGYAISAVIGKEAVMREAKNTFLSSTLWTERIGPAVALEFLRVAEKENAYKQVAKTGRKVRDGWEAGAERAGVAIEIGGIDSLPKMAFVNSAPDAGRVYSSRMLKQGWLARGSLYASTAHTDTMIDRYLEKFEETLTQMRSEGKC